MQHSSMKIIMNVTINDSMVVTLLFVDVMILPLVVVTVNPINIVETTRPRSKVDSSEIFHCQWLRHECSLSSDVRNADGSKEKSMRTSLAIYG